MHAGKRYNIWQTLNWTRSYIIKFLIWSGIVVTTFHFLKWEWMILPWQPVSLVGIAVAFYLGFKNNSSYERLWEGRKIWGGIVNSSRTFTVMTRDFVTNEHAENKLSDDELKNIHKTIVHRHVAWLQALTLQLRKVMPWEHSDAKDMEFRRNLGLDHTEDDFDKIKPYLSDDDYKYIMSKGNRASHLLSLQSKHLNELKMNGYIEDFRHMELANQVKDFYTLQGQSERIKNFPFPRQYTSVNFYFVVIFIFLLPFAMLNVFTSMANGHFIWLAIPFTALASWVFWVMELIGDYSENPFEGSYNDVPISSMARGIEIDIRQMLDETDLPDPIEPITKFKILV
jgi:putative membrane protein